MAKNNYSSARGVHVSPGIYTAEIDINYAIRSLGITTLGVVGETLKGPAFQPMDIANWREFQDVFGGTSTEKFKGSQYPKYELPYIAKSYLSESEQLKVVRVLGLSGYNTGPAWLVTASKGSGKRQAVALLRSRRTYKPYETGTTDVCTCEPSKYDSLRYYVGEPLPDTTTTDCLRKEYNLDALDIKPYIPISSDGDECDGYEIGAGEGSMEISQYNHGRFKIVGVFGSHTSGDVTRIMDGKLFNEGYFEYPVSLNPFDKEYILNVLGTKPYDGDAYVFVESLYDVALDQGIAEGVLSRIDDNLTKYQVYQTADYCHHEPVMGLLTKPVSSLRRRNVGERYLADANSLSLGITCVAYDYKNGKPIMCGMIDDSGNVVSNSAATEFGDDVVDGYDSLSTEQKKVANTIPLTLKVKIGQIYTVKQYTTADGKRHYYYAYYTKDSV